jgi:pSer/pThr/pTyr-binding forkhead associated (FHA) protein
MMTECPQCKSPVAREGQQFCYRCGQDLRAFYNSQGITIKEAGSQPLSPSQDGPVTSLPENEATTPPEPIPAMDPLAITSDALKPSSATEQKATLRILLPTGDLFDREVTRVETQLGKNPRNDIMIADSSVSTTHALIRNEGGTYTVSDLGSRNGTHLNGERILEARTLQHGDVIGLGLSKITFRLAGHSETASFDITDLLREATPQEPPPLTEESLARAVIAEGLVAAGEMERLLGPGLKGRSLYRALIEERAIDEKKLRDSMSRVFQIEVIDLSATQIDEALAARFTSTLAREHRVFPVSIEGDSVVLAVADPTDTAGVEAAKRKIGKTPAIRLATATEIDSQIDRHYGPRLIGVLPSGEKLEHPVAKKEIEIGKAPHNDVVLADQTVSNTHAVILAREGGYGIVDLGSRNGTFVNGERLGDHARTLRHGDAIQLGQTVLTFRNPGETKENVTATLSSETLDEVRRRAAAANLADFAVGAQRTDQVEQVAPKQPEAEPEHSAAKGGPEASAGDAPKEAVESDTEKKKKKKKKKGKDERVRAAYIRAAAQVLAPVLSIAATVALTIYLTRPSNSNKPPIESNSKGKPKLKIGAATAGTPFSGGSFEASGVAEIPGTDGVLFVDDNKSGRVLWMQVDSSGKQKGQIKEIDLGVLVEDPEGITFDGNYFYVCGSQSDPKAGEGNSLVRFVFDPASGALRGSAEKISDLRHFLVDNVPELKGLGDKKGADGGLNIEGIAWDPNPDRARLLLGLRSPVPGDVALIVPIKLRDVRAPFTVDNLQLGGSTIKLLLGGLGIRDIQYDGRLKSFLIIAGAPEHGAKEDFTLWEWNGDPDQSKAESEPRKEATLDRGMKPEGVTHIGPGNGGFIFIVGDADIYLKLDYSE